MKHRLCRNLLHLSHLDIPGGGQVVVDGDYAYVGHMEPPHGTSIIDVRAAVAQLTIYLRQDAAAEARVVEMQKHEPAAGIEVEFGRARQRYVRNRRKGGYDERQR